MLQYVIGMLSMAQVAPYRQDSGLARMTRDTLRCLLAMVWRKRRERQGVVV